MTDFLLTGWANSWKSTWMAEDELKNIDPNTFTGKNFFDEVKLTNQGRLMQNHHIFLLVN